MIEAISRGCKGTLSDGTIRYVFDIAPKDAASAAELFGMPGSPVVLARLTQEAAIQSAQDETIADHIADDGKKIEKPKGGELAKLAGMFCNQPEFTDWIESRIKYLPVGLEQKYRDFVGTDSDYSRIYILEVCKIESRSELDHNVPAAIIFHEQIRRPYSEWMSLK